MVVDAVDPEGEFLAPEQWERRVEIELGAERRVIARDRARTRERPELRLLRDAVERAPVAAGAVEHCRRAADDFDALDVREWLRAKAARLGETVQKIRAHARGAPR